MTVAVSEVSVSHCVFRLDESMPTSSAGNALRTVNVYSVRPTAGASSADGRDQLGEPSPA